jgi:transposase
VAIVAGFDVHRAQITFDALDPETGEVHRGRIAADRESVRGWVGRFVGRRVDVAVEACTGWLFVCEALREGGAVAHLAETAETRARRGSKRRAKTDRADARWLRTLLAEGRLPEAWIPPAHVRDWRARTRLRKTLVDERTGCRELMSHYGIGPVTATSIVAELGDVSRLPGSRKAVRCAGLDVGVHRSDQHSRLGKLTRQGSPQLRWALYEAAQSACKPQSPDHADYHQLKARGLSHTRATLTIARKLARRCFHSLRELGPAALEPVT